MWATVSEVMAEPGWPMGEDPSCFLPLTGTHGARHRLPWAPGNPNKASSLVGTRKGARTPSVPVEPLSYILAHIMVGSTPACFCCSVCEPWGAVMLLLSLVQWGCSAVCWTAVRAMALSPTVCGRVWVCHWLPALGHSWHIGCDASASPLATISHLLCQGHAYCLLFANFLFQAAVDKHSHVGCEQTAHLVTLRE